MQYFNLTLMKGNKIINAIEELSNLVLFLLRMRNDKLCV